MWWAQTELKLFFSNLVVQSQHFKCILEFRKRLMNFFSDQTNQSDLEYIYFILKKKTSSFIVTQNSFELKQNEKEIKFAIFTHTNKCL